MRTTITIELNDGETAESFTAKVAKDYGVKRVRYREIRPGTVQATFSGPRSSIKIVAAFF